MYLENLKTWQWAIIGAVAGVAIAWGRLSMPGPQLRTMTQDEFEMLAGAAQLQQGSPYLSDVVIRPSWDGYTVAGRRLLTFENRFVYEPFVFEAASPFEPKRAAEGITRAQMTLPEYVEEMARQNPSLAYRYLWWDGPQGELLIGAVGGAILVGGIWPVAIQLMIAGGLERREKTKKYDLDRFAQTNLPPVSTNATIAGHKRLDEFIGIMQATAKMEPPDMRVPLAPAKPQAKVVVLNAVDEVPATPVHPDDPKDFGGDFYPTEVHGEDRQTGD